MNMKKIIIFSVIGFVLTAAVVGGAFHYYSNKKVKEAGKQVKIETAIYSIGEMYANLKESRKILKVNIDLEIASGTKIEEILNNKKSQIANDILQIIRNKQEEELSGDQGQKLLRKEILKSIKNIEPSDDIINVYFVEFIIQ